MVQVGGEAVRVCRFSPDSMLLATAGDNGQVCIWNLIHRNLIRQELQDISFLEIISSKFHINSISIILHIHTRMRTYT